MEGGDSPGSSKKDAEPETKTKERPPCGILRLDSLKPRRLSSGSFLSQVEPPSPQPSVDRLSVTFADDSARSDSSNRCNVFCPSELSPGPMEKVHFSPNSDVDSEEGDYSASVNAIMERIHSTKRKGRRRGSSPFSPDNPSFYSDGRRRSSVFTNSSGDSTAISMEENSVAATTSQEQIFENIRLHKEVITNIKMQPWDMRRKLRLVVQAKSYVKKHEGVLQERLAQSKSTKDMLARWNIVFVQKWQHWKREAANLSNWLIPWESRIKEIESHFGSVVASYFTFLRWLFWVNIVIAAVLIAFVTVPEMLTPNSKGKDNISDLRKQMLDDERNKSANLMTLWDFEGILKYSPLFYGYYTNEDSKYGYRLPLAYFITNLIVYVYSFIATLRKMAENSRMSKLSEKDDECAFSWKIFTGWDYMIGNAETSHNRVASIVLGFKEALLEEAEKKREPRNWKIFASRVLVNLLVISLLCLSAFAVIQAVKISENLGENPKKEEELGWFDRNVITIVLSLISVVFPVLFEMLGLFERYHPRKQLRLQLARIMILNLLNVYSLIFGLFDKIDKIRIKSERMNPINTTAKMPPSFTTAMSTFASDIPENFVSEATNSCIKAIQDCLAGLRPEELLLSTPTFESIISNITSTVVPKFLDTLNTTFGSNVTTEYFTSSNSYTHDYNATSTYFDDSNATDSTYWNLFAENATDFNDTLYNYTTLTPLYEVTTDLYSTLSTAVDDYLQEILNSVYSIANDTETLAGNQSFLNLTSELFNSTFINNETTYEYFTSTFTPYVENLTAAVTTEFFSGVEDEQRFDHDTTMSTLYEDFTSTIMSTIQEYESTTANIYDMYSTTDCFSIPCDDISATSPTQTNVMVPKDTSSALQLLVYRANNATLAIKTFKTSKTLRGYCWETMFGQEIVKLTVMDLILTILSVFFVDFFRAVFVRFMNRCWCWDLEKKFPQYGDFKIAENILHLVNNQGMIWMGMFFSPGILLINLFKLVVIMYLRSWAVLTCNVPHEIIFRASRSNNFYLALLLTMLFLCVLPVGYAIVKITPSWHCGPFAGAAFSYQIFTHSLKEILPDKLNKVLDYIASPGIIIPLLILLILVIYYLISLTNSLREANNDLKIQLRRERTEERRKMFKFAERRRRAGSEGSGELATPFSKWKKILPNYPKSIDETTPTNKDSAEIPAEEKPTPKPESNKKDFFSKLIKKALRKPSISSEDESVHPQGDGTDTEQQDSLPEDIISIKEAAAARRSKQKSENAKTKHDATNDRTAVTSRPLRINKDQTVPEEPKTSTPKKPGRRHKHSPKRDPELKKAVAAAVAQKKQRPQTLQKEGSDSSEIKHVKIKEHNRKSSGAAGEDGNTHHHHRRRDTFDIHNKPEKSKPIYHKSPSTSSKEFRQDSLTSNWSDNIPVITISKTESDENILGEKQAQSEKPRKQQKRDRKIVHQAANVDEDSEATVKDAEGTICGPLAVETKVAPPPARVIATLVKQRFSFDRTEEELDTQTEESSKSERTAYEMDKEDVDKGSSSLENRKSTKTESSTDYKDDENFSS